MKKRWICLFVENEVGVLAKITGLFASKSYNLNSLTVGTTEDETVSRMTISLFGDDQTFEQVKKQLGRSVEVIKVVDLTEMKTHRKELMYIKVSCCTDQEMVEIFRIAEVYKITPADYNITSILLESLRTEEENNELASLFKRRYPNRVEIARGGSVAIGAVRQ